MKILSEIWKGCKKDGLNFDWFKYSLALYWEMTTNQRCSHGGRCWAGIQIKIHVSLLIALMAPYLNIKTVVEPLSLGGINWILEPTGLATKLHPSTFFAAQEKSDTVLKLLTKWFKHAVHHTTNQHIQYFRQIHILIWVWTCLSNVFSNESRSSQNHWFLSL